MSGNQWQLGTLKFTFNDMQIRPADSADADLDQHLPRSRVRNRDVAEHKGIGGQITDVLENDCPHGDERALSEGTVYTVVA